MSEDVRILVPLPATRFTASTVYILKEPASGFDYVLLKMIGYGNRISSNLKISEAMGVFSIAGDMIPLVLSQLEGLVKKGVVKCPTDRIGKDTPLKNITFTETGQEMFEKGFISSEPERMEKKMIFFPARRNHFESDREMEVVREKLTADKVDEAELGSFLLENREYFGISPFADIISKVRSNDEKSFLYNQPVFLHFNKDDCIFEINEMLSGVRTESLKELGVAGDDIVGEIPAERMEIPEEYGITTEWKEQEHPAGYAPILPGDMPRPKGLLLAGDGVSAEGSIKIPETEKCDLEDIVSSHEGYKYRFTMLRNPLRDFECSLPANVVLVKRMTQNEISACLLSASEYSDEGDKAGIAGILRK